MPSKNYMDYRKFENEKAGVLWSLPNAEAKEFFLERGGTRGVAGPTNYLQRYLSKTSDTKEGQKARDGFDWDDVVDTAAHDVVVCLEKLKENESEFDTLPMMSSVEPERHEEGELLSGWNNSASFRLAGAVSTAAFLFETHV
jgi:hypothetical protein